MLRRSTIAGVIAVYSLAGCAVGPNFHSPAPPSTANYTRGQQPDVTTDAPGSGGAAQTFVVDRDIPADWYGLFQSEQLDELVRRAREGEHQHHKRTKQNPTNQCQDRALSSTDTRATS